jgi:hypothetical protein
VSVASGVSELLPSMLRFQTSTPSAAPAAIAAPKDVDSVMDGLTLVMNKKTERGSQVTTP